MNASPPPGSPACVAREIASPAAGTGGGRGGLTSGPWAGGGANPVTGAEDAAFDNADRLAAPAAPIPSEPVSAPASPSGADASPGTRAPVPATTVAAPP